MSPELNHELAVFVRILNQWLGYAVIVAMFGAWRFVINYEGHYDRRKH